MLFEKKCRRCGELKPKRFRPPPPPRPPPVSKRVIVKYYNQRGKRVKHLDTESDFDYELEDEFEE
jgi:hypothetical protein